MLVERRGGAFPADLLMRVGAAWLMVAAVLVAVNWQSIDGRQFPDPDDAMRLVQVRDLIAGQGWFDLTQYRVDAPGGGVAMHWSRLVDIPLLLVILLLSPILGAGAAEAAALVIVPLVTLFIAMLLAARIAWRLLGEEETMLTSLLMALSVPLLFQLSPLRIDHHGWQVVCALWAMNALMARSPGLGAFGLGASFATWLAISVEGLPLAAAIFGVLALRWLRDRSQRAWLVGAIQWLSVVSAALFLLTRGIGDLAVHCDAIGPLHLAVFGWGALVLTLLGRTEPAPVALVLAGFALAAGGALALVLVAAPQCAIGGGFAQIDPLAAQHWLAYVNEGRPVWHQSPVDALPFVVAPLIGLIAASRLGRHSAGWLRRFWSDYALILGAALLIALFVARAGAVACALAAPPLAWQVGQWLRAARKMKSPARRMAAMCGIALALVPTFPLTLIGPAIPANAARGDEVALAGSLRQSDCDIAAAGDVLAALPRGEIYAPLDIAPALLLESRHSVVATPHHRGHEAIGAVIAAAIGTSEEARAALVARGTDYVALCPTLGEPRHYANLSRQGFAAQLLSGEVPEWLEPVELPEDTSLLLWRVRPV
ncbi:hypothetical protein Ga0102493_11829 [Erythrobacter litoralis]|jgi:hypothetical protein|nr:hypothetical protein [Erythrobacter litoralis]AOL24958.1 hypothetical protein Ga0102493_11829 [Erythrobacter litoralis]MEE4337908.1 hypothetical protein [Erythrobacter sp.]